MGEMGAHGVTILNGEDDDQHDGKGCDEDTKVGVFCAEERLGALNREREVKVLKRCFRTYKN
jgi:hypothetical protein